MNYYFVFWVWNIILFLVFGQQNFTIDFKFYGSFYQTWVVVDHLLVVLGVVVILDVVTDVVETACAYVATRTLKRMCFLLNIVPIAFINRFYDFGQGLVNSIFKHLNHFV